VPPCNPNLTQPREQNFGVTILEAQLQAHELYRADGSATPIKQALDSANTAFTAVFTLELLLNLFCHWLREFASNSWSPPPRRTRTLFSHSNARYIIFS
jgi:hypothetical protein